MKNIKCKIIGNQIWIAENLTKEQFYVITGRTVPLRNDKWAVSYGPKCYAYETNFRIKKKEYLFDLSTSNFFRSFSGEHNTWRIPTLNDLDTLFRYIDGRSSTEFLHEDIANTLRGNYGWFNNGTNKIGFDALPNPIINENSELAELGISRWWFYDERRGEFGGFGLYQDDILSFCGIHDNNAFAIRLVMDLHHPRTENNIIYV